MMNILKPAALFAALMTAASAGVTTSGTAPTTDVLATKSLGSTGTNLFSIDANANHARGQLFSLADGSGSAFEITAITIQKQAAQTYVNDTITLWVFEGNQAGWDSGTGHTVSDPDFYGGTTVTPLHEEVFTLNGTIAAGDYVSFELATPLVVPENADFGFFLTYDKVGGSETSFSHFEATQGGRISIDADSHDTSSRSMNHFVRGTAVNAGVVTISTTAPAADILSSNNTGTVFTKLFDEDRNANHARGQLFALPDGAGSEYEITAITIHKNANQTFDNDTLTLRTFEGTRARWDSGTGHSTGTDGGDYYVDTTVTPMHSEVFTLDGLISDGDFVTLQLGSPVTVNEDSDFGFFLTYDESTDGVGGTSPDYFQHNEGGAGGRISITTTDHGTTDDRHIRYFVQGVATGDGASLDLAAPFQDGMVLQRDKPMAVWGTADPLTVVSVTLDGNNAMITSDAQGAWKVALPAMSAGGPHQLVVASGLETTTLNDVLIGDVWLAFGQSNMVQVLGDMTGSAPYINEIEANGVPVRCLKITQFGALTAQTEAEVPAGHSVSGGMNWLDASTSETWTSVGTVFACRMYEATGVPTAIIWAAWGSSSIEGWMPAEMAGGLPYFADLLPDYYQVGQAGNVHSWATGNGYSTNTEALTALFASGWSNNATDIFVRTRSNVIYNQMIHPLLDIGISGFVWYQGEANTTNLTEVARYGYSLPALITEYRERFGQGDLPFLGVQLPSFNNSTWPWFREAQNRMETLPNAHAAVTIDTGLSGNIHPPDKEPVGIRLSLLARKYVEGEMIEAHGPRFGSMNISGNQATVSFTHADGLTTDDALSPAEFELAGSDEVFHGATSATISGTDVILSSTSVASPVAVRYAWSAAPVNVVNLVNSSGLPAAPFRTDSWDPGLGAQAPQGIDDSYEVAMNTTLNIAAGGVLENDIDLNYDALSAVLVSDAGSGSLSLLADGSFSYIPHNGFAGTDSFTYRCSDGALLSADTTVTITVTGELSGYYTWRTGIPWNPGDDPTESGDPDHDGSDNLLEYALGMNPLLSDPSGLPTLTPNGSDFDFDFNNLRAGVRYEVLLSTDLVSWSDPPFAVLTSESTTPVLVPSGEAVNGRLYVRLRVAE